MRARARARHAKPSNLRNVTLTTGLATVVTVPLVAQPAAAHTSGGSSSSYSASGLLRVGSTGSAVAAVQRRLHITADGVFGRQTQAAVVAFQRSRGLAADGVVGPRTAAALGTKASSRARASSVRVSTTSVRVSAAHSSSTGSAIVRAAASHAGKPYRWGATGPNAFDCSGFTQYVHRQAGISIPRTSGAQAAAGRRVAKSDKRPGDLIAIYTNGRVSHVAIYAGGNSMWVARRSGTTITKQNIYTSNYSVHRFAR